MEQEPDFQTFARSWIENDSRTADMTPERINGLVNRLAEAMARRRTTVDAPDDSGELTVSIDRSRLHPGHTVDLEAIRELASFIEEIDPNNETP